MCDGVRWFLGGRADGQPRRARVAGGARDSSASAAAGLSNRWGAVATDAEAELDGSQEGNDARVVDDGAGGAAAGTSHEAETRPPEAASQVTDVDPAIWKSWSRQQRKNYLQYRPKNKTNSG